MFIEKAYSQVAEASMTQNSSWLDIGKGFAPFLVIIVIFYFLIIRPQQKKLKAHHNMISNLKKGDKIVTAGGIIATVCKLESETDILLVDIASDVKVKIKKDTISQVLSSQ